MDSYLTADLVAAHPRLTLVRCLVRALSGDMDGARQVYQAAAVGDGSPTATSAPWIATTFWSSASSRSSAVPH